MTIGYDNGADESLHTTHIRDKSPSKAYWSIRWSTFHTPQRRPYDYQHDNRSS